MKLWTKKVTVPANNETKEVDAIQLWCVRWKAVNADGSMYWTAFDKLEAFPSEKEAEDFAQALKQANELIGNKNVRSPVITKN